MAVIKAGLYKFNDEIVFPSSDAYININFTTPDLSYVCNSIRFNTDLNIVAYYFGEQSSSIYYNGWITGRDRTFKVLYNTTVDDDSYNIFKENINVFIPIGTYEFNYSSTPPSTGSSISTATLKVRIPDFELVENGQRKILNTDSFEYTLYTNFSLYGVVGRAIGFAYNQQNLNHIYSNGEVALDVTAIVINKYTDSNSIAWKPYYSVSEELSTSNLVDLTTLFGDGCIGFGKKFEVVEEATFPINSTFGSWFYQNVIMLPSSTPQPVEDTTVKFFYKNQPFLTITNGEITTPTTSETLVEIPTKDYSFTENIKIEITKS